VNFPKLLFSFLLSFEIVSVFAQNPSSTDPKFAPYVKLASELNSRARANVYFANPQGIFRGVQVNFVNVGRGNLTVLRRDIVASGRIPIVLARVYDSSSPGSIDFGPGWSLSAGETISLENHAAHLLTESGSVIDFVEAGEGIFVLAKDRPSDYFQLREIDPNTIEARLRTGFVKQYTLLGNSYRLTKVVDRNANELRLIYENGRISRIENAHHFIAIKRNEQGRIIAAQDDQNRQVHYRYDPKGNLVEADDLGDAGWRYTYTEDGSLRTAIDPMQRLNYEVTYDDAGRVRRLRQPSGVTQYAYDPAKQLTTVADRKNLVSRYFQNEEGITIRIVNALAEETGVRLDEGRNPISLSRNGKIVESMEYDKQHRLITRHNATSQGAADFKYKYDAVSGALAGIDASNGAPRTFKYDQDGQLSSADTIDGLHRYRFTSAGDLAAYTAHGLDLSFVSDPDGLLALAKDGTDSTGLSYKAGGELSEVGFADGTRAKYEYQPSGLRSNLTYNDGRQVRYTYDPAGNLLSTEIFDAKGKQVQGQKLMLNESYQVMKRLLFDGTEETFEYDANGNLTKHTKNGSVTRFEYDELNRLVAVLPPGGERLTYTYDSGERSIVEQYEHSSVSVADLIDSGFTFGNTFQVLATRPVIAPFGAIRFSESLGTVQLANAAGNEIITPETTIEQALQKLSLVEHSTPLKSRQNLFNRPFNTIFMPAEYASINCCFSCSYDPSCRTGLISGGDTSPCCPPCDPPPPGGTPAPPAPHITGITPPTALLNASPVPVTLAGSFTVASSMPQITINPSGVITASVTGSSSSQITANFTFANTASVGNYTVSVIDDGGPSDNSVVFSLLPYVTQDKQLWWFGGQTPPSTFSLGALQATFTANGVGSQGTFTWAFATGSDKASFPNNQSSITVTNSNTVTVVSKASSITANDVSVTLTYTPPNASPLSPASYLFAVDAPFRLDPFNDPIFGTITHRSADSCTSNFPPPSGANGYTTGVSYRIFSRLGVVISNIGINEAFGGRHLLQNNNWPNPFAKGGVSPDGSFLDAICVTDKLNQFNPQPLTPRNPLGSDAVDETQQSWFVGSVQPGVGVKVQNDSLKRYTDHGIHTSIQSPVTQ
jgi:YD repeat-containing protein